MKRLLLALPLLALALAAAGAPLSAQSTAKKDRHFITEEEVRGASAQNAYDLVRALRPQWLRTRGDRTLRTTRTSVPGEDVTQLSTPEIVVYMEGIRFGKQEDLRGISVADLGTLRFLDANSATQRFGTGHPNGAILLTRRTP
ncbi:MAG TPA: hypothetical protein VHG51_02895 [Longimicrobiaceae bacterium]|nr:hypothetical protein [Longimicrobiaceae bacterium]